MQFLDHRGVWQGRMPTFRDKLQIRRFQFASSSDDYKRKVLRAIFKKVFDRLEQLQNGKAHFTTASFSTFARGELVGSNERSPILPYTYMHCREVGDLAYILARELQQADLLDYLPEHIAALMQLSGYAHDIGKRFIPRGLLGKELWGALADFERDSIRYGHLLAGVALLEQLQIEHDGDSVSRLITDNVGCHHINFSGIDHPRSPSYGKLPGMEGRLIVGSELPIHQRILKLCDLISARLRRYYRVPNGEADSVDTLEKSIAFALTVVGTEVDPRLFPFLLKGIYNVSLENAIELTERVRTRLILNRERMQTLDDLLALVMTESMFGRFVRMENRARLDLYSGESKPAAEFSRNFGGVLALP